MDKHWTYLLEQGVKNPKVQFTVGTILLVISVTEIFFEIQPKHCIALIGIHHIIWAMPNILQALERIARGRSKG